MKKIVCELCEGTEFAKDGGMFICQGCGTKYTVEEARGMMVEVEGDAPAVTNSAPSFNINQQQLDNILTLANSAYEADKKKAAEEAEKRRIEEYWEAHKEEKEKLEAERANLEGKVKEYTKEFNELENLIKSGEAEQAEKTPSEIEEENVHNRIKELSARRERLGLFSGKEKKQIDAEVADLKVKLTELTKAAEEERTAKDAEYAEKFRPSREKYIKLKKEIDVVKMQIATISSKLSKAPNE